MTLFTILSVNVIVERMLVRYYDKVMSHSIDNKVSCHWFRESSSNLYFVYKEVIFNLGELGKYNMDV